MRICIVKRIMCVVFIFCANDLTAQSINQLWGAASFGGKSNAGTIFSLDGAGNNFKKRHEFEVMNPGLGQFHSNTKLAEWNGKLYGTTIWGGTAYIDGGTIFEWDPVTNTFTNKYNFRDHGWEPGDLTFYNGKFYGTTALNYENTISGVLFEWDPSTNVFTKKYDLPSTGETYATQLVVYNGKLYGNMPGGGSEGNGIIFEWDPATNTYTEKKDFRGFNNARPIGEMIVYNGKFYGMSLFGGSTGSAGFIYEWDPVTNVLSEKFQFSNANGGYPEGGLSLYNSKFYGMTSRGGINNMGVIFEWDPASNVFTKKFDFNTSSGMHPYDDLELYNDKFYGMTYEGGAHTGGTIFEWDPTNNVFNKTVDMTQAKGSNSYGGFTTSGGKLYGMTSFGGTRYTGTLIEYDPSTSSYTKKIDLNVDKGQFPLGNLAFKNGKLYGVSPFAGDAQLGMIYEWNTGTSQLTEKINFGTVNGSIPDYEYSRPILQGSNPVSSLVEKDNKYYGIAGGGLNEAGVLYEWDPATNTYTKKYDLPHDDTIVSTSSYYNHNVIYSLTLNNDRFYGTIMTHEAHGQLFEWNPTTNVYTKKIDFTLENGVYPNAGLSLYNGKYYGTTIAGGTNDEGVIFEWDPVTNIYTKKFDFGPFNNGIHPKSGLTLLNGKFYGTTFEGGSWNGVLYEWDPSTNIYTKKFQFIHPLGTRPVANMVVSGGNLYGITTIDGYDTKGSVFEWNPNTNTFRTTHHFSGADGYFEDDGRPSTYVSGGPEGMFFYNGLIVIPAPVASGNPGTCVAYSPITIDNSNNNVWVPLVDENGDAVAEIKANGNNLGTINYSLYVHNGAIREDANNRLYLDRNLTITPQNQPSTPVQIKFYITDAEFQKLKNASNSQGLSSGVNNINDIGFFKNGSSTCSGTIQPAATVIPATGEAYNTGYILTASISSFSSFYMAKSSAVILPVTFIEFNGKLLNSDIKLDWTTASDINVSSFDIERSENGRSFIAIGNMNAIVNGTNSAYTFTDKDAGLMNGSVVYYRIKQKDINGKNTYSGIIPVYLKKKGTVIGIYPNLVENNLNLSIATDKADKLAWSIIGSNGNTLLRGQKNISPGSSSSSVDVSKLPSGVYYFSVEGDKINEKIRFVKQ